MSKKTGETNDSTSGKLSNISGDECSSEESEEIFTDILSSDSDDSSFEEMKLKHMTVHLQDESGRPIDEKITEDEETVERMIFYSIYIDDEFNVKKDQESEPQYSDGYKDFQPYSSVVSYMKDAEAKGYIIEDYNNKEFEKILNSGLNKELELDDIDGNISIKTLAEKNFEILNMEGPTRKIALIFNFKPEEETTISNDFRSFMTKQIDKFTHIGGVLLLYKEIGIHVVEGSEYTLLRHFPQFFKSYIYMKLLNCKVLGIGELSAMKSFKFYACYIGVPPKPRDALKKKINTHQESIEFMKKIGKHLNKFLKFVYGDQPNVSQDNYLPQDIAAVLPPKEYLEFSLSGDWTPGLRGAKDWFYNSSIITAEADDSEFVWPPRSDHLPSHFLHTTTEEDQNLRKAFSQKVKHIKLASSKTATSEGEKHLEAEKRGTVGEGEGRDELEDLIDEEHEWPSAPHTEISEVDPEELNPDLEDFLEHIESIKM